MGRVRNIWRNPPLIVSQRKRKGYLRVSIRRSKHRWKVQFVHRLVLVAFHGQPPEGKTITRHVDGSKDNNRADNHAWGTPK